jgi:diguanylate cyclase (GGDEF)-like protein
MKETPVPSLTPLPDLIPPSSAGHPVMAAPTVRGDDGMRLCLEQTLALITAESEDQVIARTLIAACAITRARLAVALEPGHGIVASGDPLFTAALSGLDLDPDKDRADDVIAALALAGLPVSHSAQFEETLVVVAAPDSLAEAADTRLALLVAQAAAVRTRLRERTRLAQQAESDPLTGLRHSRPFVRRLNASSPGRTAIIEVDVDGFKRINDEYGHEAGDRALLGLVDALRSAMRGDDQLYRIGGDEFAVVVDVNGPAEVDAIARRLLEAAREAGQTISVGAAVHMVGETGRDTLGRADQALYQAKRAGRDTARLAPAVAA